MLLHPYFKDKWLLKMVKENITIDDICQEFQVSSATVRNWIKVGELELESDGYINAKSVITFKKNTVGKTKLNKRANKLSKNIEDTLLNKEQLLLNLKNNILSPEQAHLDYQALLTDVEKNKFGVYYTPTFIVQDLLKYIPVSTNKTFCDPCCGTGNFIVEALKLGFTPDNVYGFDIDPIAVEIARARFKELTGLDGEKQIQCLDFLQYSQLNQNSVYDYIYTNPPWGQKISKEQKSIIAQNFSLPTTLVNDTCSLFFAICARHLADDGALGFLLPDAVFNIGVYEPLRQLCLSMPLFRLADYGKAFKGLQTGAVLIEIDKKYTGQHIVCQNLDITLDRQKSSFLNNPKNIFNIHCSSDEALVINHLYQIPHALLNENFDWGLGIVTGNNAKHIQKSQTGNLIPIYRGNDIFCDKLNEPSCFIENDFSLYQQVAPLQFYQAKEKLIYRFISSKLIFYYDDKQRYVLNSANMLIPKESFGYSLKLLADILNSDFMNWIFQKLFNTHKILRSDLECLPIHFDIFLDKQFDEQYYLNALNVEKTNNGTYRLKK